MRWDRDSERFFGFVLVACAVVCFNHLERKGVVAASPAGDDLPLSPEVAWPARMATSMTVGPWRAIRLVRRRVGVWEAHRGDTGMPTGVGWSSARRRALVSGPAFQVGRARHSARGPLT